MQLHEETGELPTRRRQKILLLLEQDGKVLATELSQRFGVSEDTIRRDLNELARTGLLHRVHGGALPRASDSGKDYLTRAQQPTAAKQALAREAARQVRDGQVVFFDSGTTNVEIARLLPPDIRLTAVTHSPQVAVALARHEQVRVLLAGGELNASALAVTGHDAVQFLQRVHADLCFLGICALHPEQGISVADFDEVATKGAMLARAGQVIAAVTSDKLGTVEPYALAPASRIDLLITEADTPASTLAPYRSLGIPVVLAG